MDTNPETEQMREKDNAFFAKGDYANACEKYEVRAACASLHTHAHTNTHTVIFEPPRNNALVSGADVATMTMCRKP